MPGDQALPARHVRHGGVQPAALHQVAGMNGQEDQADVERVAGKLTDLIRTIARQEIERARARDDDRPQHCPSCDGLCTYRH